MKANHKKTIAALAGIVLGALAIIVSGNAAVAQDTVRVRGTIETIDGPTYVIKARDGGELKVALPTRPSCRGQGVACRHQTGLVCGRDGNAAG
jgi:hypothetical protein